MIRSAGRQSSSQAGGPCGLVASLTRCGVWPFGPDCGPELLPLPLPQLAASDLEKKVSSQPGRGKLHM